jgi:hypothetical protein
VLWTPRMNATIADGAICDVKYLKLLNGSRLNRILSSIMLITIRFIIPVSCLVGWLVGWEFYLTVFFSN